MKGAPGTSTRMNLIDGVIRSFHREEVTPFPTLPVPSGAALELQHLGEADFE